MNERFFTLKVNHHGSGTLSEEFGSDEERLHHTRLDFKSNPSKYLTSYFKLNISDKEVLLDDFLKSEFEEI